jgi:hypothetical protein
MKHAATVKPPPTALTVAATPKHPARSLSHRVPSLHFYPLAIRFRGTASKVTREI